MYQIQVLGTQIDPRCRTYILKSTWIQVQYLRFRSQVQNMSYSYVLDHRFRSQDLQDVQDLGPKAWKCSQNQDLTPRKGPRFRPQFKIQVLGPKKGPRFRPQVQDLAPRSQKRPQIQDLGPRLRYQVLENVLDSVSSSKIQVLSPRFMSQVLEKVQELGSTSQKKYQVQVISSRKCPTFRALVLDLGPWSQNMYQIQVLGTQVDPRCRTYVLKSTWIQVQYLRFTSQVQKMSYSYVLDHRFMSQDLEDVLDLGPKAWKWSQNQDLTPRKGPRFRSCVLRLCPSDWKSSYNQVVRPRNGPGISQQVLEKVFDLGLLFLHFCPRSQ